MKTLSGGIIRFVLLLPAAVLCICGYAHFRDGAVVDAAIPVPSRMTALIPVPRVAYVDADNVLREADARDGEALIARAEAQMHATKPSVAQTPLLIAGLSQEPASLRGWVLLSQARQSEDRAKAAQALSQALLLGPYDYWNVYLRARQAASLWSALSPDEQAEALEQTRMLWEVPVLRTRLRQFLFDPDDVSLAARAFVGRNDEVRQMNRWLEEQRLRYPLEQDGASAP